MVDRGIDTTAKSIEAGEGCSALNNYLINRRTESKDDWRALLQDVKSANEAHRAVSSNVPELTIVSKPDSRSGERIGLTRKDLEDAGAPNRLVDRIYGVRGNENISRSYDCSDFSKK